MSDRILVIDFFKERRDHLMGRLRERFPGIQVSEMVTQQYDEAKDTDFLSLHQLQTSYDLIIGHLGGNPSGYQCLKTFKEHNPKGKAILYTKMDSIPLDQFEGLKLANMIVKRAPDDRKVFANDEQMLDVVSRVLKEPGIVHWTSPFKDKAVATTLLGLATAVLGALAAALKVFAP